MALSKLPTLKQSGRLSTAKILRADCEPVKIERGAGNAPSMTTFSDNSKAVGSCLHCPDAPCMEYREEELVVRGFPQFPADAANQVCPTSALEWPIGSSAPSVNPAACISCGLCVSRCPVAAISLNGEGIAVVNDQPNEHFLSAGEPVSQEVVDKITKRFNNVSKVGRIFHENDQHLKAVFLKLERLGKTLGPQFPNLLSRNLLLEVGIGSAIRRRGDTNIRMDMVLGPPGVVHGVAEVEFGFGGILDAPRNLLDNVAVLCSRYGFEKKQLVAMLVASELPNQRSEYWQLVRDIAEVLGVRIGSITWGALILIVWEGAKLTIRPENEFYTDISSYSIREAVEKVLGRRLTVEIGYPGFLQSQK